MSVDNGGASRGLQYSTHDLATFTHCRTTADTTTDLGEDGTDCYNCKKPTSASSVTLKQTSTPSPSYPSANSWPGFGNRYARGGDIQVPTVDSIKSPCAVKYEQLIFHHQKLGRGVYVFSSKMANDATLDVRQKKYESIIAWHEANCRPSTSKCDFADDCQAAPVSKKKRRSVQDCGKGSPLRSSGTPSVCSPSSTMLPTPQTSGESSGNPPSNPSETPSGDLLMPDDRTDIADNPLRRMERMTQDSLFEPPSKMCRTSSETIQPAKREQDRNAKLEKMRTLEQQIMYDKAKTDWGRMMHEARGYMSPVMPACSQASVPTPYPCFANQNGVLMQGPCRQHICPQQMSPNEPASAMQSLPMMVPLPQTTGHAMPSSQPLRPSLNPSACGIHYTHNSFMCCPYPSNVYPPQGYPSAMPTCFPSNFPADNAAPQQPRDMYPQGIRTICPPEKVECELWNRQLPPAGEFDNRFLNQKLQYHPNGAIISEKMVDAISGTNPMFA